MATTRSRFSFGSGVPVDWQRYIHEVSELIRIASETERARLEKMTGSVDLDDRPTLASLVDGVVRDGRRLVILRDGTRVAERREPPPGAG